MAVARDQRTDLLQQNMRLLDVFVYRRYHQNSGLEAGEFGQRGLPYRRERDAFLGELESVRGRRILEEIGE
jgi:hypothetical protein